MFVSAAMLRVKFKMSSKFSQFTNNFSRPLHLKAHSIHRVSHWTMHTKSPTSAWGFLESLLSTLNKEILQKHIVWNEWSPKTLKIPVCSWTPEPISVLFRYSLCCIDRSLQEISLLLLLAAFMSELGDLPSLLTCLVEDKQRRWTRLSSSSTLRPSSCSGWFLNSVLVIEMFLPAMPAHIATKLNKKKTCEVKKIIPRI